MKTKDLIAIAFLTILVMSMFFLIAKGNAKGNGTERQTYAIGNDGGYVPVYAIRCMAMRMADTVEVEWNGNLYTCYIDPESEIQTGDIITCRFMSYEGNYELIDIL